MRNIAAKRDCRCWPGSLSQRHGFKCTVLFSVDPDGTINPNNQHNLPDAEGFDSADEIIMLLRFRAWPDDQMKHFADAVARGVPVIGLRHRNARICV